MTSAASASTTQTKLSPPFSVLAIPQGYGAGSTISTVNAFAPLTACPMESSVISTAFPNTAFNIGCFDA
eukprot:CAMPEP_0184423230 /NCGR_PEP_ID=MMETSP0738-20130409/88840_1 /TAXON_ID=385413 /ORGANISM="Thalassiosira miniscula, Strain CCMP1093" /LENGTH=68 /DNA_ID=CAMNT_0026785249 /DNA_START=278 /DNA_END=481 /DNA_ORIENTATION=+